MLDQAEALLAMDDEGQRRERRQPARQHHRTRARPTAAMGGRESLVQIEMHGVDAKISGPDLADDGVEIGPVAIEVRADFVHRLGDLQDLVLEQPAGVGIGQHDAGDIIAELRLHHRKIDPAAGIVGDGVDVVAAGGGGRGVGAMGGFRHQDPPPGIALRFQCRPDAHHAAKLALGAGRR